MASNLTRLAVAAALTCAPAALSASSITVADYSNYCTTGAFVTCASVQVVAIPLTGGGTVVQVLIQNLQGAHPADNSGGYVFGFLELQERSSGVWGDYAGAQIGTLGPVQTLGIDPSAWDLSFHAPGASPMGSLDVNISGNYSGIVGCDVPGPVPISPSGTYGGYYRTCGSAGYGGFAVLTVTFTGNFTAQDVLVSWNGGGPAGFATCNPGVNCYQTPVNVIPEPATLILLASGLSGIGAAARRKRRSS